MNKRSEKKVLKRENSKVKKKLTMSNILNKKTKNAYIV